MCQAPRSGVRSHPVTAPLPVGGGGKATNKGGRAGRTPPPPSTGPLTLTLRWSRLPHQLSPATPSPFPVTAFPRMRTNGETETAPQRGLLGKIIYDVY